VGDPARLAGEHEVGETFSAWPKEIGSLLRLAKAQMRVSAPSSSRMLFLTWTL